MVNAREDKDADRQREREREREGGEGKRRKGPEEIAFGRRNGSVTINRTAPFLRKKKRGKEKKK